LDCGTDRTGESPLTGRAGLTVVEKSSQKIFTVITVEWNYLAGKINHGKGKEGPSRIKGLINPSRTNLCGESIRNTRKNNILMITITIHKKPTIMVTILTNFMENKPKWMGEKIPSGEP